MVVLWVISISIFCYLHIVEHELHFSPEKKYCFLKAVETIALCNWSGMFISLRLCPFKNETVGPTYFVFSGIIPKIAFPERGVLRYLWLGPGNWSWGLSIVNKCEVNPLDHWFPVGVEKHRNCQGSFTLGGLRGLHWRASIWAEL